MHTAHPSQHLPTVRVVGALLYTKVTLILMFTGEQMGDGGWDRGGKPVNYPELKLRILTVTVIMGKYIQRSIFNST